MASPKIKAASGLLRRQSVPDAARTPTRDDVADWIEEHVIEGDRQWSQTTMTDVAEANDVSRELVSQMLDDYFVPEEDSELPPMFSMDFQGEEGDNDTRTAYRQGLLDGIRLVLEETDTDEEREEALRKLI